MVSLLKVLMLVFWVFLYSYSLFHPSAFFQVDGKLPVTLGADAGWYPLRRTSSPLPVSDSESALFPFSEAFQVWLSCCSAARGMRSYSHSSCTESWGCRDDFPSPSPMAVRVTAEAARSTVPAEEILCSQAAVGYGSVPADSFCSADKRVCRSFLWVTQPWTCNAEGCCCELMESPVAGTAAWALPGAGEGRVTGSRGCSLVTAALWSWNSKWEEQERAIVVWKTVTAHWFRGSGYSWLFLITE